MNCKTLILFIVAMKMLAFAGIAQWTQVGADIGASSFHSPSLAFHPSSNEAYIAYVDTVASAYVVKRFDGTNWIQVGGAIGNTAGNTSLRGPSLVFRPSTNEAHIAYYDPGTNAFVVQKFDGINWVQVGSGLGPAPSTKPDLAFDPSSSQPCIPYAVPLTPPIQVLKFNGTAWTQFGPNLAHLPNGFISLAFHPNTNEVYLGYESLPFTGFIVTKLDGTNWTQVGNSPGYGSPSIAFHPSNNEIYVAYRDYNLDSIVAQKFNGNNWIQVGSAFGIGQTSIPEFAFHPATHEPFVAYSDLSLGTTRVQKFDGTSWVQVGANLGSISGTVLSIPSLAFHPTSNEPYIAHFDFPTKSFVVKKYLCNSSFYTDTQMSCDSFLWIDGNTYNNSNNSATYNLTNSGGCDSIVTLDLTITSVNNSVSQNGNSLTAAVAGAAYQWLDCDSNFSPLPGATNQGYSAIANGIYAVEITQNGCVDTSACYSVTTVNIDENNFTNAISIFPNPTNTSVSIDLGSKYESVAVSVFDINGKKIHSEAHSDCQQFKLECAHSPGVYFLTIQFDSQYTTYKVVKK